MATPARHSTARGAYHAFDDGEDYAQWDLLPGERIGPAPARRRGRAMLWSVVVILIALGGWAMSSGQATWPAWLPADIAAVLASMDRKEPRPAEPAAPAVVAPPLRIEPTPRTAAFDPAPPTPLPPAPGKAAPNPAAAEKLAAPSLTTGALPPASRSLVDPPFPPLRPAIADPADPYQMRAAAVGLHPELSRALLARLSPTDYRNAGIAIQTALAETSERAVFVWPHQRKPELARFQVRFVPGAASGCRRYVVTVAKDGWLTTALPMEKCGSQPHQPRRE